MTGLTPPGFMSRNACSNSSVRLPRWTNPMSPPLSRVLSVECLRAISSNGAPLLIWPSTCSAFAFASDQAAAGAPGSTPKVMVYTCSCSGTTKRAGLSA